MTIEEIEQACDVSRPLDFSRHELETPELAIQETLYPLGFAAELRTNSVAVQRLFQQAWATFKQRFDTRPMTIEVHVAESNSRGCPEAPRCTIAPPLVINIADAENFSIGDMNRTSTKIRISEAASRNGLYVRYFFLDCAPLSHIATQFATPIHAACVSLDGIGALLCGDSGAGKSSLAYACARAGWRYITDDCSFLLADEGRNPSDRLVTGNCHQIRFRPAVSELFPEMAGLEITPRAAGKPSIEVPTGPMKNVECAQTAQVDFLVFLNRRQPGRQEMIPYRKDVARSFLHQVLYGTAESLATQHAALEKLLSAEVFELRYDNLDWAVDRLATLVRDGR